MQRHPAFHDGFSLIELAVTMAVVAMLLVMAVPNLAASLDNGRVRTTADLIQDGLRVAQSEAIKQNRIVEFVVTSVQPTVGVIPPPAAAGAPVNYWYVATVPWTSATLNSGGVVTNSNQRNVLATGILSADANQVVVSADVPSLCFSPYGRLTAISNDPTSTVTCSVPGAQATYQVSPVITTRAHPLNVTVSMGGQIRLCDTQKLMSMGYPDGC